MKTNKKKSPSRAGKEAKSGGKTYSARALCNILTWSAHHCLLDEFIVFTCRNMLVRLVD
jgi:hypothetical protein